MHEGGGGKKNSVDKILVKKYGKKNLVNNVLEKKFGKIRYSITSHTFFVMCQMKLNKFWLLCPLGFANICATLSFSGISNHFLIIFLVVFFWLRGRGCENSTPVENYSKKNMVNVGYFTKNLVYRDCFHPVTKSVGKFGWETKQIPWTLSAMDATAAAREYCQALSFPPLECVGQTPPLEWAQ